MDKNVSSLNAVKEEAEETYTERQGELRSQRARESARRRDPGCCRVCDLEKMLEKEDGASSLLEF